MQTSVVTKHHTKRATVNVSSI